MLNVFAEKKEILNDALFNQISKYFCILVSLSLRLKKIKQTHKFACLQSLYAFYIL